MYVLFSLLSFPLFIAYSAEKRPTLCCQISPSQQLFIAMRLLSVVRIMFCRRAFLCYEERNLPSQAEEEAVKIGARKRQRMPSAARSQLFELC